jgi:hypothetical protein
LAAKNFIEEHPRLQNFLAEGGSLASLAIWVKIAKNATPLGIAVSGTLGSVVDAGYDFCLKHGAPIIARVHKELAGYLLATDPSLTQEQADILADVAVEILKTSGRVLVHLAANKGVQGVNQMSTSKKRLAKKHNVAKFEKDGPVSITEQISAHEQCERVCTKQGGGGTQKGTLGKTKTTTTSSGTSKLSDGVQKTRLPELPSGNVSEGKLMDAAEKWLGKGYKDMGNGRYVSKDGLRQFRYGKHETKTLKNHHAHFETYDKPHGEGGVLIEKSVVSVIE